MGREVRRVPADWQHPRDDNGEYIPLFDGYTKRVERWDREKAEWDAGIRPTYGEDFAGTYEEWDGERPEPSGYMPDWPAEERTHLQMYEDTTEGTPISPVMSSPEELARWLADNAASWFGGYTADYEQWLIIATPADLSGPHRTDPTSADPGDTP
jgi:hypothetical protein